MDFYLEQILDEVRVVDSKRNYWFIRTYSGLLYDDFKINKYVGVGFNDVPYNYLKEWNEDDPNTYSRLQHYISTNWLLSKTESTKWANQLINFEHNIKDGDIVIIPSKNSEFYSFGLVEGGTHLKKHPGTFKFEDKQEPYPEKRKKINWLKEIAKDELNGDLRALSSSHQAITSALKYGEVIEGLLSTLYIKQDKIYLNIKVTQDEDINAFHLQSFLESITFFYKEFCSANGEAYNEDLYIKIKLQSPGNMALKAGLYAGILGIAGLMAMSNNPEIKLTIGDVNFSGKGAGGWKSLTEFLDAKQERKKKFIKFQDSMENLKAKTVVNSITPEQDSTSTKLTVVDAKLLDSMKTFNKIGDLKSLANLKTTELPAIENKKKTSEPD
ncbi:hypothetical protein [Pedobacter antarcticus]|uniref:hypothetical protein n=1 Tax=Pedobacter antarcticus TaxID=34086 RepID=UPI00292D367F|nr:hypothetical protein [Pedobacter antarcticus]